MNFYRGLAVGVPISVALWIGLLAIFHAVTAKADNPQDFPTTNRSVTIATGNTFQVAVAAVANFGQARRSLEIQNNNTSDSCWVFVGSGTATKATSIILDTTHGTAFTRYYPFIPSDQIQATCANNGDTLYVATQ